MSKAYVIGEGMVTWLEAGPALDSVNILVDRQLDLATEIEKALGMNRGQSKGKGAFISIFYNGFENPDASAAAVPSVRRTYQVSIYAAPVIKAGFLPADDLVEAVALRLHQWEPAEDYGISEIHVVSGTARPDDEFLIYDLEVRVQSRL